MHLTVTIVNHEGKARVVYIVTLEYNASIVVTLAIIGHKLCTIYLRLSTVDLYAIIKMKSIILSAQP